jgi:hypothetical protein
MKNGSTEQASWKRVPICLEKKSHKTDQYKMEDVAGKLGGVQNG